MKKWMAIMLLIALALFGSVIGFNMFKQKKIAEFMANRPEPEFPVTAMVTKAQDWVPTIEAIGFIEPGTRGHPLQRAVRHHRQHPVRIRGTCQSGSTAAEPGLQCGKSQPELFPGQTAGSLGPSSSATRTSIRRTPSPGPAG